MVSSGRPLRVDEILAGVSPDLPKTNVSTIYRAIQRWLEDGQLVEVALANQPPHYELAEIAAHHHHHFRCLKCEKLFDVEGCVAGLEALLPKGFVLESHEITLEGKCAKCG